ncbi:hypothetical protein GPECTOR_74g704 [Gonium pectorale]|uniref:DDT domain-containing protein n=1 Tax=Gonium pectorale TaxID=33097 RepID=A0A150G467_GONPE|nr:hypothetical protein GPECTOR_74g704 [Gonium pectorale]|eukprot:KXZ44090.1 hypothetical protein GPECTOR_74g704 [Gonium pectorale]
MQSGLGLDGSEESPDNLFGLQQPTKRPRREPSGQQAPVNSPPEGESSSSDDDSDADDDTPGGRRGRGRGRGRGRAGRAGRGRGGRGGRGAGRKSQDQLFPEDLSDIGGPVGEEVGDDDDDGVVAGPEHGRDGEPGPPVFVLIEQPNGAPPLEIPGPVFADIVSAYNILRSFSWQLKLSPFSLTDLCIAMCAGQPCELLDQLHVCILRTLAAHETSAARRRRRLDLEHLDEVTWPEFVWEWLELAGEKQLMKHRAQAAPEFLQHDAGADGAGPSGAATGEGGGAAAGDGADAGGGSDGDGDGDADMEDGSEAEDVAVGDQPVTGEAPADGAAGDQPPQPIKRKRGRPRLDPNAPRPPPKAPRLGAPGDEAKFQRGAGLRPRRYGDPSPRRWADDLPHASSLTDLQAGPRSGCKAGPADPEAYANRYRHAWENFVQAMKVAYDTEYKKSKRAGATPASALAVPLPLPSYSWPIVQAKKPCLLPLVRDRSGGLTELVAEGRLAVLQHYLLRTERELWGLLDGGWAAGGSRGLEYRRMWVRLVREAETPAQLAPRFLELEAALRRSLPVLAPGWDPYRRDPAELALLEAMAADRQRDADQYRRRRITSLIPQPKKGPGRPARKKMPAHLQMWNNLRSQQAAATRTTPGPGGAAGRDAGSEAADDGEEEDGAGAAGMDVDVGDSIRDGSLDDLAATPLEPPPPRESQSQPPDDCTSQAPASQPASQPAGGEVEAGTGGSGGRSSRRRSRGSAPNRDATARAAAAAAAAGGGGAGGSGGAGERGPAPAAPARPLGLDGELVLDKWWRDLLASYGEVDAVDLLGAAAAAASGGGDPLEGPERRAALRQARTGWMWWRPPVQRAEGLLALPRDTVRRLARKGGSALVPQGVIYHTNLRHTMSRRLAWIATTQHATSVAQLAVQARLLEDAIQWERIRPPLPAAEASAAAEAAAEAGGSAAAAAAPQLPPEYAPYVSCTALARRVQGPDRKEAEYLLAPSEAALLASHQQRQLQLQQQQQQQQGHGLNGVRILTGSAGVSQWVPESSVPLWLVRGYEERLRGEEFKRAGAAGGSQGPVVGEVVRSAQQQAEGCATV